MKKSKYIRKKTLSMSDYKKFKFIDNFNSKYTKGDFLGSGAFGVVCKCTLKDTGNEFAVKIMKK